MWEKWENGFFRNWNFLFPLYPPAFIVVINFCCALSRQQNKKLGCIFGVLLLLLFRCACPSRYRRARVIRSGKWNSVGRQAFVIKNSTNLFPKKCIFSERLSNYAILDKTKMVLWRIDSRIHYPSENSLSIPEFIIQPKQLRDKFFDKTLATYILQHKIFYKIYLQNFNLRLVNYKAKQSSHTIRTDFMYLSKMNFLLMIYVHNYSYSYVKLVDWFSTRILLWRWPFIIRKHNCEIKNLGR